MSILKTILDCIMPPYEGVRELEQMTARELVSAAASDDESKKARPLPVVGLVAAFPYRARLVKAAIVEIKSNKNKRVARLLAEAIYIKIEGALREFATGIEASDGLLPILAPMPMTRKRRRERGWNQCELVCEELAGTFIYMKDALVRTRETADQVGMSKKERAENMKGSFAPGKDNAGNNIVNGRDVIILDDVATTGATLREARSAAIAGGARRVLLVSIGY